MDLQQTKLIKQKAHLEKLLTYVGTLKGREKERLTVINKENEEDEMQYTTNRQHYKPDRNQIYQVGQSTVTTPNRSTFNQK